MSWFFITIVTTYLLDRWCCSSLTLLSITILCRFSSRFVALVVNLMINGIISILKACVGVRFLVALELRLIFILLLLIVTLRWLNLIITTFVFFHAKLVTIITYSLSSCSNSVTLSTAKPVDLRFWSFPFCCTLTIYIIELCFCVTIPSLTFWFVVILMFFVAKFIQWTSSSSLNPFSFWHSLQLVTFDKYQQTDSHYATPSSSLTIVVTIEVLSN